MTSLTPQGGYDDLTDTQGVMMTSLTPQGGYDDLTDTPGGYKLAQINTYSTSIMYNIQQCFSQSVK